MFPAASSHLNPAGSLILTEAAAPAPRPRPLLLIGQARPGPAPPAYDVSETRFEIRARRSSASLLPTFHRLGEKSLRNLTLSWAECV